jgi:uncharacterized membrane protein YqiK
MPLSAQDAEKFRYLESKKARIGAQKQREVDAAFHADNRRRAAQAEAERQATQPESWEEYRSRLASESYARGDWATAFSAGHDRLDWSDDGEAA